MAKNLMIVESPSKCAKLTKILNSLSGGKDSWDVKASVGHVLALNKEKDGKFGTLGFDRETLDTDYVPSKKGRSVIADLKSLIRKNNYERIILAPDPDREGEAIAEHLRVVLGLGENYERCTFNEITTQAVKESINNPRKIDNNLVMSQDARRILDRVVGWDGLAAVSRVLGEKTPIGRVQSKVVDFVVSREIERKEFKETKYFGIKCDFEGAWKANLDVKASGLIAKDEDYWTNKEEAEYYSSKIKNLVVLDVEKSEVSEDAPMPFDTMSMQQAAINKLGFSLEEITDIAQKLYQDGHITYIRTDSTAISDEGFGLLKAYCEDKGYPVLPEKRTGKSGAVAQEAHECIRPTDFTFDSSSLSLKHRELYELIKIRCLASQLEAAKYDKTAMKFKVDTDDTNDVEGGDEFTKLSDLLFKASGRILKYEGWRVLLSTDDSSDPEDEEAAGTNKNSKSDVDEDTGTMPDLAVDEVVTPSEVVCENKVTKMPPRYTQSSLLKKLERHSVGRPSTYKSIFQKIGDEGAGSHGYVLKEGKGKKPKLVPSDHAVRMVEATRDFLSIMDTNFTKEMEGALDDIANGEREREQYLRNFLELLNSELSKMIEVKGVNYEQCPKCKEHKLRRIPKKEKGKFFWGCNNDECRATFSDEKGKPVDRMAEFLNEDGTPKFECPKCKAALIRFTSRKKEVWWRCVSPQDVCNFIVRPQKNKDAPDLEQEKSLQAWLKAVEDAKNPDGTPKQPCPECKNALVKVKVKDKDDAFYYRCASRKSDCGYTCSCDDDGNPVHKDKDNG